MTVNKYESLAIAVSLLIFGKLVITLFRLLGS